MIEFYPQIKWFHLCFVASSVGLFVIRAVLVIFLQRTGNMVRGLSYLSYFIDTLLLTSALMLLSIVPDAMFANHWLRAKLAMIVAYIVLASFALKRAQTRRGRILCFIAALGLVAQAASIALRHHPFGWLQVFTD